MDKKEKVIEFLRKNYAFFISLVVIIIWHFHIVLNFDSEWFSVQLDQMPYIDYIATRYHEWTSRILIETSLIFFTRHMVLWRIVDTAIWMFILYSVTKILDDNYTARFAGTICLLFACYRMPEMNTAGWVATINNYIWPFAALCGLFLILKKLFQEQKIKWQVGSIGILFTIFACNHEQVAAAVFGSILCYIAYMIWKKIKISKWIWGYLFITIASLVFILTCPGNAVRKEAEISTYFQNFSELKLWQKLDMGITSLCHYSIFEYNYLFLIFLVLLCIVIWKKEIADWKKYIALIPVIGTVVFGYFLDDLAGIIPEFINMRESLRETGTYMDGDEWSIITILFYVILMICVLWELILILKDNETDGIILLVTLGIGFGTRFMMCLAPSIWISTKRTFIFWQMALIIASGHLWNRYFDNSAKKKVIALIITIAIISLTETTVYLRG